MRFFTISHSLFHSLTSLLLHELTPSFFLSSPLHPPPPTVKVLATSGSNIAVDNLVEGLAAAGIKVLRLGRPESIRPELTRHCLDYIIGEGTGRQQDDHARKMRALNDAEVICATCIGSGSGMLDRYVQTEHLCNIQCSEIFTLRYENYT